MSRTRRMVVIPEKSHHRSARPYKRTPNMLFKREFDGIEVTIEKDDRRGHSY